MDGTVSRGGSPDQCASAMTGRRHPREIPEKKMTEQIAPNPASVPPLAPSLEPVMTDKQFCQWMVSAKPSDRIQFHVGHLMLDRMEPHSPYEPSERVRPNYWQIAPGSPGRLPLSTCQPREWGHLSTVILRSLLPARSVRGRGSIVAALERPWGTRLPCAAGWSPRSQ